MADLLVEPVIEKLIEFGLQYLKDQVRWKKGLKEELQSLQQKLPNILAVVNYASSQEQIEIDEDLNKLLWELRAAVDAADDVLDEFEYLKLKKQLINTKKQRMVSRIMKSINERVVFKTNPTLKRLKEVVHELNEVSTRVATFPYDADQTELHRARETESLPKNDLMIGRDDEKVFVMNWLKKTSNEDQTGIYSNISLLSVVGPGGIGKTTLLQSVYNDEITMEFDLKMWFYVSQNFVDEKRIITDMLYSLTNEMSDLLTLSALQYSLHSVVKSKKFLLVLDDIWGDFGENEERSKIKWENLLAPLASGKLGSKILVTTRMESVALMLSNIIGKNNEILRLKDLAHNETLSIFKILKLSYISLPIVLKNCLSFCSIFPQGYKFDKDELIRMWIALGFIQSDVTEGKRYFDTLFERFDKSQTAHETYYKMHDLQYEMLQAVFSQGCLSIVGDDDKGKLLLRPPKTIRHLYVQTSKLDVLEEVEKFENLRSFIFFTDNENLVGKLVEIFKTLKRIRLICINAPNSNQMAEGIGDLIHLRFFKFFTYER